MLFNCSQEFYNYLDLNDEGDYISADDFDIWELGIHTYKRKKIFVFLNRKTKFPIVLYGITTKDENRIYEIFTEELKKVFFSVGVSAENIDNYLQTNKYYEFKQIEKVKDLKALMVEIKTKELVNISFSSRSQLKIIKKLSNNYIQISGCFYRPVDLVLLEFKK